ncbi:unnamed protein product (macronuclear) [Paramecium tetraurelia]|uniref:Uncharacterized protein n=1 Tax=Paramecium tetraurelia TaxID=5888 RepID=A0BLZ1_PARTE|nr:uncharacterized protein GSPATT00030192001 [Paramecium tetraurelia]CAK59558.1 unnamed protein product [Paramecium tetraurelia]|eukprot:XP_001426956.1 hypothetical protein (macronuclear) [Paramecium tetraurelia strain d4-2]
MSSDLDLEIQSNFDSLFENYERLGTLDIKTKADVEKATKSPPSQIIQSDSPLDQEIGSALRIKQRDIKAVQKESKFCRQRDASINKNTSQLNISKESIERKGILKNRDSFHSSSSDEKITPKHVKFSTESSKFVHMALK